VTLINITERVIFASYITLAGYQITATDANHTITYHLGHSLLKTPKILHLEHKKDFQTCVYAPIPAATVLAAPMDPAGKVKPHPSARHSTNKCHPNLLCSCSPRIESIGIQASCDSPIHKSGIEQHVTRTISMYFLPYMLAPLFLLLINSVVFNYRSGQMLQINVKLTSKM